MWLALPALYYSKGRRWSSHTLRFCVIELWASADLCRWERVGGRGATPFLPYSAADASGAWDLSKNLPPSGPLARRGADGGDRFISNCHFAVQPNHFIPGFLSYSVAAFQK